MVCALSCATTKPVAERSDLAASLEAQFGVSGPTWLGTAPSAGSPSYEMSLEALRSVVDKHPEGVPSRVRLSVPCVLQVVRASDFTAANPSSSIGLLYECTWIDLHSVSSIDAKAFGRDPHESPSLVATCAWLAGTPGFARSTEIVTDPNRRTLVRRTERDEATPQICVGNEVESQTLVRPLRQLVSLCGGRLVPRGM